MFTSDARRVALLSALGGAIFLPYALSKAHATDLIVANGWRLPGLSATATANAFHIVEAVPIALLVGGALALAARYSFDTALSGTLAIAVVLAGFAGMTVAHVGEHLLPALTVPALTGDANWYLWGYYAGWLGFHLGVTLCGLVLVGSLRTAGVVPWLFVFALPLTVGVGGLVVFTGLYTFAGTSRLIAALMWLVGGAWLWSTWSDASDRNTRTPGETDPSGSGHSR